MANNQQSDDGWWCPTCKDWIDGAQVTYTEYHETCGTYLGNCQPRDWEDDEELKELEGRLNDRIACGHENYRTAKPDLTDRELLWDLRGALYNLREENSALRAFARHAEGCSAPFGDYPCKCGFGELERGRK